MCGFERISAKRRTSIMDGEFTIKLRWYHCGDDNDPRWGYMRALPAGTRAEGV